MYNYSSLDGGPDQYLMWNVVDERVIDERAFEDQNIHLTVRELTVRITESKPDGRYNKLFTPNQFTYSRYNNNNNNGLGFIDDERGDNNV